MNFSFFFFFFDRHLTLSSLGKWHFFPEPKQKSPSHDLCVQTACVSINLLSLNVTLEVQGFSVFMTSRLPKGTISKCYLTKTIQVLQAMALAVGEAAFRHKQSKVWNHRRYIPPVEGENFPDTSVNICQHLAKNRSSILVLK